MKQRLLKILKTALTILYVPFALMGLVLLAIALGLLYPAMRGRWFDFNFFS